MSLENDIQHIKENINVKINEDAFASWLKNEHNITIDQYNSAPNDVKQEIDKSYGNWTAGKMGGGTEGTPYDEVNYDLIDKWLKESKIREGTFKKGIIVKLSNIGGVLNQEFFGTNLAKARQWVKEAADAMDPGDIIAMDEGESESTTESKKIKEDFAFEITNAEELRQVTQELLAIINGKGQLDDALEVTNNISSYLNKLRMARRNKVESKEVK